MVDEDKESSPIPLPSTPNMPTMNNKMILHVREPYKN